jgi:hypothetical protein
MPPADDDRYPVEAPGWAAIDRALGMAHPGVVPHQFASKTAYDLDSPSPLPAVSVYEGQGPEHWHYVTYGLTELFEKTSADLDVSGFGYELTFRLPRHPHEDRPPVWPIRLLQGIGHYVLSGHGSLDTGHVVDLGGPLCPAAEGSAPTPLHGVVCVPDPTLTKLQTPHGSVLFLLLFGMTSEELEALETWELRRKVGLVHEVAPAGITDPLRSPLADDPRTAPIWRRHLLGIMI